MFVLANLANFGAMAHLPVLGSTLDTVYLVAQICLGVWIAFVGHLAWAGTQSSPWRRLRFLGLITAVGASLQALAHEYGVALQPIVSAGLSVIDLALVGMAISALNQVITTRRRQGSLVAVLALLLVGVFCGLLGGAETAPLLARNLVAAVCHVLGLAALGGLILSEHVDRLMCEQSELRGREAAMLAEQTRLAESAAAADRRQSEAAAAMKHERIRNDQVVARNHTLERVLLGAIDFGSLRIVAELQRSIVEHVQEIFGLQKVALHIYSPSTQAFEARAFVGIDDAAKAFIASSQVSYDEYLRFATAPNRVSNSFLVDPQAVPQWEDDGPSVPPIAHEGWPSGLRLIVPLVAISGDVHGFFEAWAPASGKLPDLVCVRHLEFLARFATNALESAEAHDRLARNNAELAQVSEKLKSLGDMKSNFLANVSHELRTPLTSMLAYTEMLRRKGDTLPAATREEFLDIVTKEGERLSAIIDDLLQLDRMEDGQARLQRVHTDIVALARRLSESWHEQARNKGIDFAIGATAESIDLEVDAVLCQQLLQHLVGNALKFTPDGGQARLHLSEQGTAVRIEVTDTGIGIPEEHLHAIFEQFYQVDDTATREHNGQGVGLAICQDIVSYHDGRIWAENIPPCGTRFTVLLPRRTPVVVPATPLAVSADFADPRQFLQRLLHWIGENVGVELVSLMTPDAGCEHLIIRAALGLPEAVVQSTRLRRGAGYAGRVWVSGRTLLVADVKADPVLPEMGERGRYTTNSLLVVPLKHDDQVIGVVMVNNRLDGRPLDDDDRVFLEAMAPRLAYLLERFDAHTDTSREFAAIQEALRTTTSVGCLHHTDVAAVCRETCLATARRLDLSEEELRHLAFSLQYYDAGMGCVPPYLLNKEGELTGDERSQLERHVQASLVTLAPLRPPSKVRQMILHHHEHYDGRGYPSGLAGEAIPLGSRLIALADSLRALLQNRPYRPAVPLHLALEEIRSLVGIRYCPRLAGVFLEEATARRTQVEQLRERADDGEDLKRPAPAHPAVLVRD